jgi:hypothetical protein
MPIDDALETLENVSEDLLKEKKHISLEKDIKFLKELDEKLHTTTKTYSHTYGSGEHDDFTDEKMDECDFYNILSVAEKYNLIVLPENVNWGFSLGFKIKQDTFPAYKREQEKKEEFMIETILLFRDDQLPNENFIEKMFEYIHSEKNLKLIEKYGYEKPSTKPSDYEY